MRGARRADQREYDRECAQDRAKGLTQAQERGNQCSRVPTNVAPECRHEDASLHAGRLGRVGGLRNGLLVPRDEFPPSVPEGALALRTPMTIGFAAYP